MVLDWDTFYFQYWVDEHTLGDEPTHEDYTDWMYDQADRALGEG